jgi:hypothetical protein
MEESSSSSSGYPEWLNKFKNLCPLKMPEKDLIEFAQDLLKCCSIQYDNNNMSGENQILVLKFFKFLLENSIIDIRCSAVSDRIYSDPERTFYTSVSLDKVWKTEVFIVNEKLKYEGCAWLRSPDYIKLHTIIRFFGNFLCKE